MSKLLDLKQLSKKMKSLPEDWFVSGDNHLSVVYEFETVKQALEFVVCVGRVSEKMDHHPDVTWSYKKVELRVTTHEAGGLTNKDFDLAKKVIKCL